jgi:hypothetical protein
MQLPSKWISTPLRPPPPHPRPALPLTGPAGALSTLEGGMHRALHSSGSLAVGSNSNLRKPPYASLSPPPTLIGVLQRLRNTDNANRNRTGPTGNNCRSSTRFPLPLGEEISVRRRHARFSFARSRACPIKGMLIKIHVGALGGEKRSIKSHRLIN